MTDFTRRALTHLILWLHDWLKILEKKYLEIAASAWYNSCSIFEKRFFRWQVSNLEVLPNRLFRSFTERFAEKSLFKHAFSNFWCTSEKCNSLFVRVISVMSLGFFPTSFKSKVRGVFRTQSWSGWPAVMETLEKSWYKRKEKSGDFKLI